MSHIKPVPVSSQPLHVTAPSVTLLRWGASISLSLVLLACGGAADLQLGQDSNALEGSANDEPNSDAPPGVAAPTTNVDPTTGEQALPGTAAGGAPAPGQVYLVDPATGQLFLPCEVATTGVGTDVPPSLPAPALTPAPTTEVDSAPGVDPTTGVPAPSEEHATAPAGTPVSASGSSAGVAGVPADGTVPAPGVVVVAVPGNVPCGPVGTASGHSTAGGQPGSASVEPVASED
jgi:hypothetical protein